MKKLFLLLLLSVLASGVRAMSFEEAQRHALFLSDKMAYELGLTPRQFEEVYQINFDYLLFVEPGSVYGNWWRSRNAELRRVLTSVQYAEYERTYHFYRPVHWRDGAWHYGVYGYYTDRTVYYRELPRVYRTYRGGRYFGPRPGAGPRPAPRPGAEPRPGVGPRPGATPRPGAAPRPNGLRDGRTAPRQNTPAPRANGLRQSPSQRPNNARPGNTPQRSNNLRQGNTPQRSNNLRQGTTTQRPNGARQSTTTQRPNSGQRSNGTQRPNRNFRN